ncbi:MAG: PAS domain S-box protein [Aquabacterium sp.]|nr:MAG: PAS domain S-box protein [Aquabacterium sp.]
MNAEDTPLDAAVHAALFDAYPDALLLVGADGRIVLANPVAARLLGYESDDLVGLNVDALVPDAIRSRHADYRAGYAAHPRTRPMGNQMDLVARRRDGSQVMVEIALSPLVSQGRRYVVTAIRAIGDYPRVKQALQRARYSDVVARLGRLAVDTRDPKHLLQQVPVMTTEALDVEAAAVYLFDTTRTHFVVCGGVGLAPEEHEGARLPNEDGLLPGRVMRDNAAVLWTAADPTPGLKLRQGYLDVGIRSALAVPLSDRGRAVGVLAAHSRDERRFGEDEQRFLESMGNLLASSLQRMHTEEQLSHSQRLESVGQLTGGIAHDFNNLLTVIQGNLQVMEDLPSVAGDPHAQRLVAAATRASRRGAELTGKLLAFSRRQVLQPGQIDTSQMLHSLADMLRRTLDQHVRISVDAPPSCPPCVADPGQLESALLNIAINARDAMPAGGTLGFTARAVDGLPEALRAADGEGDAADPLGRYVAISVSDTGAGMPDEVKERAFEPFFTTKEAGRGTGLGLATVYGFVKQSHGAVALDSELGAGTTLTLYIPVADACDTDEEDAPAERGEIPPGLEVLLVEDDGEVRAVVRAFLDALGCKTTACSSAEEALRLLDAGGLGCRLLLTDIALGPGMRGIELARLVEQRLPGLAVILMSGFSSELLDANRDAPEHWELLKKPYGREELADAVARVIAAG